MKENNHTQMSNVWCRVACLLIGTKEQIEKAKSPGNCEGMKLKVLLGDDAYIYDADTSETLDIDTSNCEVIL